MKDAICHRAFFAAQPSQDARTAIHRESLRCGAGRRVLPEHLHLTLAITGDYPAPPEADLDRMMQIAEELRFAPFELTLDLLTGSERSLALCLSKRPAD